MSITICPISGKPRKLLLESCDSVFGLVRVTISNAIWSLALNPQPGHFGSVWAEVDERNERSCCWMERSEVLERFTIVHSIQVQLVQFFADRIVILLR